MYRIAIIWWWAAWLMTAATLLERIDLVDAQIHIFEKNSKLWAKVIISGGWRCNVTTGFFKMQELLPKYPRWALFLKPALEQFWPRAIKRWFEAHGVPLKQEEDGRIFPVSDNGKDIVWVFERLFNQWWVDVHCKEWVLDITYDDKKWFRVQTTTNQTYDFTTVVLTTGWNAYSHTGSSGDGYAWSRSLWHTITPLWPSLNSFLTQEERLHACSGISFSNSVLVQWPIQTRWPLLLTHFGISWPSVFAFSSHIPYEPVTKENPYTVLWKPDATKDTNTWLWIITNYAQKKEIASIFRDYFPKKFVESVFAQYKYDPHMMVGNCTKQIRLALATLFGDGIPLTLMQRRPWDEFVTAWGVSLDEVDQNTGESRLLRWLYFAWELLDIDWYTWWYNLTSSRATGRLVWKKIWNWN
jgi:predicted Rossmann fold flavoprotein